MIVIELLQKWIHGKNSVFYQFFISNLIFLCLPILIGTTMYMQLIAIMHHNAIEANKAIINQIRQDIDSRVLEIKQFGSLISLNTNVQEVLDNYSDNQSLEEYRAYQLMKEIGKYSLVSSIIDSYAISINGEDDMISANGKSDIRFYYDNQLFYNGITYNQWHDEYVQAYAYQAFHPVLEAYDGKKLLTFIQSLGIDPGSKIQKGNLHILIDKSKLLDNDGILQNLSDSELFILGANHQLLMSSDNAEPGANPFSSLRFPSSSSFDYTVNGEKMMISSAISGQSGWNYVLAMPKQAFMAPVTKVKHEALALAILYILAGVVLGYYVAKKNYSPLGSLLAVLKKKSPQNEAFPVKNEWDAVKASFEGILEQENQLRERLQSQFPLFQSRYIHRLISGRVGKAELNDSPPEFLLETIQADRYAVLLIDIDDCNRFLQDDSEQQWALVRFIVMNILHDLLKSRKMGSLAADIEREQIGCLVNHGYDSPDWKEQMTETLTELSNTLAGRFSVYITVAISDSVSDFDRIGACYAQAQSALAYKWLNSRQSLLFYSDIGGSEKSYNYSVDTEGQLINLVKNSDADKVLQLLDQVYETNIRSGTLSPELGKWLMVNLIGTLLRCLQMLRLQYRDVYGEEAPDARMAGSGTVDNLFNEIKTMYVKLCRFLKDNQSEPGEEMMNELLNYLHQHVYDGSLGLESAADYLGLSAKYVSRLFKSHTGETLTNYIAKMRVEEAKRLLGDTDMTILDISCKLGYATDIGLIRIFKKHEGITPGKYRSLIGHSVRNAE